MLPNPKAERSKARVCAISLAGIPCSNHTGGMDACSLLVFFVVGGLGYGPCRGGLGLTRAVELYKKR